MNCWLYVVSAIEYAGDLASNPIDFSNLENPLI